MATSVYALPHARLYCFCVHAHTPHCMIDTHRETDGQCVRESYQRKHCGITACTPSPATTDCTVSGAARSVSRKRITPRECFHHLPAHDQQHPRHELNCHRQKCRAHRFGNPGRRVDLACEDQERGSPAAPERFQEQIHPRR